MHQAGDLRQSLLQRSIDQPAKGRRRGVKGGADGIAGSNGGEQKLRAIYSTRLGGMPVLPRVRNHARPASFKALHSAMPPSVAERIEVIINAVDTFDACQQQPRWLFAKVTVGLLDPMTHQALIPSAEDMKAAVDAQKQQRQLSFTGLEIQMYAISAGSAPR